MNASVILLGVVHRQVIRTNQSINMVYILCAVLCVYVVVMYRTYIYIVNTTIIIQSHIAII